jgi:DNA-binding MarR family transcriptional regulator
VLKHASGNFPIVEDGEDALAPWRWLLLGHAAALRAIERDLADKGLIPLAWYDVLLELNAAPGRRLRMSELGERVVLSRTRVSRIVDDLVGAGLVERRANPGDGRSSFAQLTQKGRAEFRRTAPHYLAGIQTHFLALLDKDEQKATANAMKRVAVHHQQASSATR